MRIIIRLFSLLALTACAQSIAAQGLSPPSQSAEGSLKDCEGTRANIARAWMAFVSSRDIGTSDEATAGSRMLSLLNFTLTCGDHETQPIAMTRLRGLSVDQLAQMRSDKPGGRSGQLAKCLFISAPVEALAFVTISDRSAYDEFMTRRQLGGVDTQSLLKLISASEGCGDLVGDTLQANQLYADINWYTRVLPNIEEVLTWNTGPVN